MNHLFPYQQNWQVLPKIGSGDGEFTLGDTRGSGEEFLYHAIHIEDDTGFGRLAKDGERVDGTFITFDGGEDNNRLIVYAMVGKGMPFRNGTTTVIPRGSKLVGAERAGATPEFGYVKPHPLPAAAANIDSAAEVLAFVTAERNSKGIVRDPVGAAHATLTQRSPADVIVEFGIAAGAN